MEVVILHASDAHCNTDAVKRVLKSENYDAVVFSGDAECIATAEALLRAPAPVAAVTGNMDTASISRLYLQAGVLLDGRIAETLSLKLGGVGGLDPASSMERLLSHNMSVDILVTHHPPRGVLDLTGFGVRAGLEQLWKAIGRLAPRLHLFGHIHESSGYEGGGGVIFVNPGPLYEGRYALVKLGRTGINVSLRRIHSV